MAKRKPTTKRPEPLSPAAACLYAAQRERNSNRRRFLYALAYGLRSLDRADMDKIGDVLIEVMGRAYLNFVLR